MEVLIGVPMNAVLVRDVTSCGLVEIDSRVLQSKTGFTFLRNIMHFYQRNITEDGIFRIFLKCLLSEPKLRIKIIEIKIIAIQEI
jgi:hypothetical protein